MKKATVALVVLLAIGLFASFLLLDLSKPQEPVSLNEDTPLKCDLLASQEKRWVNKCPVGEISRQYLEVEKRLWANPLWSNDCRLAYEAFRWRECECSQGYLDFLKTDYARKHGRHISETERQEIFRRAAHPAFQVSTPDTLPNRIASCLNVSGLIENVELSDCRVQEIYAVETKNFRQTEFIMSNTYTGASRAILLEPKTGVFDTLVLCLPGHTQKPEEFRDAYLASFGKLDKVAFLIIAWRAMCADDREENVSKTLFMHGHKMLGLQAWEVFLWRQYWKNKQFKKFALMGHSGGSVIGSVLFWLDPEFSTIVVDETAGQYIGGSSFYHDKAPCLWKMKDEIYDLEKSGRDTLRVPYDYDSNGDRRKILNEVKAFWKEKLLD